MWEIEDKKDRLRKNGEIRTVRLGVREWGKTTEIGFFYCSHPTLGSWWADRDLFVECLHGHMSEHL